MKYLQFFLGMLIILLLPAIGLSQDQQLADSLNRRGLGFYESGNYRQAEYYLREAFKLYKKEAKPAVWLSPGMDYAEILVDRAKYDQALSLFKELKKVAASQKDIKAQARIENDLGWTYIKIGQSEKALNYYQNAIPLAKRARDTLRLGYIFDNIGSTYNRWGNYKTALEYYHKSLFYQGTTNKKKDLAIILNNMGSVYKKLALFDKAFKYYERSLVIRKQLGNMDLLATINSNLGGLFKEIGNLNQALVYYQKSLEYCRKSGNPVRIARTLNNIGTLYIELGQSERAHEYYRQSLQLKKHFASPASMAISYKNIANWLWDSGQRNEATHYYKKALRLKKQAGNPLAVATSLLDLARVEQHRKHSSAAFNYANQARTIADSSGSFALLEEVWIRLGMLHQKNDGDFAAVPYYKKALKYSRSLDDSQQLGPLMNLAYAYNHLDSDSALYYGHRAFNIIEKERRSLTGSLSQLRAGYFKRYSNFYIDMASWLLKFRQDASGAFQLAELAKARTLTDDLVKSAKQVNEQLPENELVKRAQQRANISNLYSKLKRAPDSTKASKIKSKIRQHELDYASFEYQLHQKYPKYKTLNSPEPVSARQVQKMCNSQTAILEYAVTDKQILIFFISNDNIRAKRFVIGKNQQSSGHSNLSLNVSAFRKAILARLPEDSLSTLSAPLYNHLLAPFQEEISGYNNLTIVPDSYLAYLPFEALKQNNNYLVSQYNIKYEPSMTVFPLIKAPRKRISQKLLAIGNSAGNPSHFNTPLLPTVGVEIQSISQLFDHAMVLQDQKITEKKVKKMMHEDYSFIHIAAHSVIDEQHSFMSGIMLDQQPDETGLDDDGYLRSSEIFGMNIPSDLVVLSACKSGVGHLVSGEGMLGLQRAFFSAGTSAVMVSLWDVYDRSTTRFMRIFYQSLLHKNNSWTNIWSAFLHKIGWDTSYPFGNTAAAVQKAKLSLLHSAMYHHPVYWAPFIVVGR